MAWWRGTLLGVGILALSVAADHRAIAQTTEKSPPSQAASTGVSGLPLPRFVSVTAARANLRKGPGRQYPIDWILQRKNLPVEIIGEYEHWRKIRERSGEVGWVHKTMLSGKRMGQVIAEEKSQSPLPVYTQPLDGGQKARPALLAQPGAIGEILGCSGDWCELAFKEGNGWLRRENLWGVYPGEVEME